MFDKRSFIFHVKLQIFQGLTALNITLSLSSTLLIIFQNYSLVEAYRINYAVFTHSWKI